MQETTGMTLFYAIVAEELAEITTQLDDDEFALEASEIEKLVDSWSDDWHAYIDSFSGDED